MHILESLSVERLTAMFCGEDFLVLPTQSSVLPALGGVSVIISLNRCSGLPMPPGAPTKHTLSHWVIPQNSNKFFSHYYFFLPKIFPQNYILVQRFPSASLHLLLRLSTVFFFICNLHSNVSSMGIVILQNFNIMGDFHSCCIWVFLIPSSDFHFLVTLSPKINSQAFYQSVF